MREVTVKAGARKGPPNKMAGKVRHIMIEPAENGATTKTFRHPTDGENKYDMPEPMPMLHTDADAMAQHIVKEVGSVFPKKTAGKNASTAAQEGKAKKAAAEVAGSKNSQESSGADDDD